MKRTLILLTVLSTFALTSCEFDESQDSNRTRNNLCMASAALVQGYVDPIARAFWDLWTFDVYQNPPEGGYNEIAYASYEVRTEGTGYYVSPGNFSYDDGSFRVKTNGPRLAETGSVTTYIPFSTIERHLYTFTCTAPDTWTVEGLGIREAELKVTAHSVNSIKLTITFSGVEREDNDYNKSFTGEMQYTVAYGERVSDMTIRKAGVFDVDFRQGGYVLDWARLKYDHDRNSYYSATTSRG